MKKYVIDLKTNEEILAEAHPDDKIRAQLITATKKAVNDGCEVRATVLNGKILNWSIYYDDEFFDRYKTYDDALKYLKSCGIKG